MTFESRTDPRTWMLGRATRRRERSAMTACLFVLAVVAWSLSVWAADANASSCEIKPYAACADADLAGEQLAGKDLTAGKFQRADLTGANLAFTRLQGAYLSEATLRKADLSGADLAGATLVRADLSGAALRDANFADARMDGTILRDVDAREANFKGAQLQRADFRGADLREAVLIAADLAGANLEGANVEGAQLDGGAWKPGTDLSGATWIDGSVCAPGSIGRCKDDVTGSRLRAPSVVTKAGRRSPGA